MHEPIAVLFSAGLDSAVLLAHAANENPGATVQPLYVSTGLAWELEEQSMSERLFAAGAPGPRVLPPIALRLDMRDVYPADHWAVRGEPPGFHTADEDVFIEGRNVVLLAKAAVFMTRAGIARVMLGTLAGNPFPDASREFRDAMSTALSVGLNQRFTIEAPFAALHKADVIRLGRSLGVPLELTLSCMQPRSGIHCGRCSKCRERRDGFREAGGEDPTIYAATEG
jgi:7-cyano-7-deazaguanine synthase